MNIIFLDVDGVLNSVGNLISTYNETHKPYSGHDYPFDVKCLTNLQKLVLLTKSKIVITSSWRKDGEGRKKLLNILREYNLDKEVIGYTPVLKSSRGLEIKSYLESLDMQPNFVIIDDDSDVDELIGFLIQTNIQTGLTEQNVLEAIDKLNSKYVEGRKLC